MTGTASTSCRWCTAQSYPAHYPCHDPEETASRGHPSVAGRVGWEAGWCSAGGAVRGGVRREAGAIRCVYLRDAAGQAGPGQAASTAPRLRLAPLCTPWHGQALLCWLCLSFLYVHDCFSPLIIDPLVVSPAPLHRFRHRFPTLSINVRWWLPRFLRLWSQHSRLRPPPTRDSPPPLPAFGAGYLI